MWCFFAVKIKASGISMTIREIRALQCKIRLLQCKTYITALQKCFHCSAKLSSLHCQITRYTSYNLLLAKQGAERCEPAGKQHR
jgi:hypothetical protein